MKTSQNILAKAAVLVALLGLSSSVQAQSKINVAISSMEISNLENGAQPMHMSVNPASAGNAASDAVRNDAAQVENFHSTAEKVATSISAARLAEGDVRVSVKASSDARALLEEEALNVKVSFDARPIGGILNVQVSMTPSFRGVGVATRPSISRSAARAVDELNDATVQEIVRELTLELQTEFARQDVRELTVK